MKIALSQEQLADAILQYARRKNLFHKSTTKLEVDLPQKDAYGVNKKITINIHKRQ